VSLEEESDDNDVELASVRAELELLVRARAPGGRAFGGYSRLVPTNRRDH